MKSTGDRLLNDEKFLRYCQSDEFEKAMDFLHRLLNKQDFNYKYKDPETGKS